MKNMILTRSAAMICAGAMLMTSASLTVSAESTALHSEITANLRICVNDTWLYCAEDTGTWFDAEGNLLTDKTEHRQTALYEGKTYTVDLDQMQVFADDGSVNEELSALLPTYLAYRPLSFYGIDGVYFDELYGTAEYDAAYERVQKIADSIPLTYAFSETTDSFVCYIYMPNDTTYFAGMQYSFDANDYPEAVPFCNAEVMNIETGSYTLPDASFSNTTIQVNNKTITRVHLGDMWLYYDEDAETWFDAEGNLLTDKTEHRQTALYEGKTYTVDLDQMQVFADDGSVNEELSALLPTYLAYRPLSFYGIDGVYFDELYGTAEYDAAYERVQKIADSIPLTYAFSETTDSFVCYIYMPNDTTYFAGMQYSFDANDYPEAVPFCNAEANVMNVESDYLTIGDVSINSKVDVADAVLMARIIAEDDSVPVSQLGLELMDVNNDNYWDINDLRAITVQLAQLAQ